MYLGQLICHTFPEVQKVPRRKYVLPRVPGKAISTPSENQNINKHEAPSGKKKTGTGAGNTVKNSPL